MRLQLDIQPLDDKFAHHEFVTQKCLLPQKYITSTHKIGCWLKCYWTAEAYAVCQLFPSDAELSADRYCYLNACVKKGNTIPSELIKLEQLKSMEAKSISVIVELAQSAFVARYKRFTLPNMQHLMEMLLQTLHFCVGSTVETPELRTAGIDRVIICAATGVAATCESECAYTASEATQVCIADVALSRREAAEQQSIMLTEVSAYQELRQLLELASQPQPSWLPMNALIIGPSGCGKSSLIKAAMRSANCNCFTIGAGEVVGQYPGEAEAAIRQVFEAAAYFSQQLKPKALTVVLLENLHQFCPATQQLTASADVMHSMRICAQLMTSIDRLQYTPAMVLATTNSIDSLPSIVRRPGRFEREFIITQPSEELRALLLQQLFAQQKQRAVERSITPDVVEHIARRTQGYVLADLALLVQHIAQALIRRGEADEPTEALSIVKQAIGQFNPASLKASDVSVLKPVEGFASIAGMAQLKRELAVSLLAAYKQQAAFKRFGLRVPKGILLYGPPGCGKTKFAKCLAYEANMTFIATSGAEVYSPYVGVAEKFVARIFDTARRNAPCLIFFDEIDTLVGKRQHGEHKQHDVQLRILSTLLTEMDGIIHATSTATLNVNYNIMVVAATNRPDMLDDALLRPGRFDKLVHVPPPDYQSRIDLLQLHATQQPFAVDISLAELAECTANYSGADISSLCSEAALHALHTDENANAIKAADFEFALNKVKPSLTAQQIQFYYAIEKNIL